MIKSNLLRFAAACLLSTAACSGGDNGGSGVDGSKALTELSPAEINDLCEYGETLISEQDGHKLACYFSAIFFSETEEDCQTAYDACIAQDPEPSDSTCDTSEPPACASMVTVAELESCSEAQADGTRALINGLSCSSSAEDLQEGELPPACKAIEEKCPELFEDEPSSGQ